MSMDSLLTTPRLTPRSVTSGVEGGVVLKMSMSSGSSVSASGTESYESYVDGLIAGEGVRPGRRMGRRREEEGKVTVSYLAALESARKASMDYPGPSAIELASTPEVSPTSPTFPHRKSPHSPRSKSIVSTSRKSLISTSSGAVSKRRPGPPRRKSVRASVATTSYDDGSSIYGLYFDLDEPTATLRSRKSGTVTPTMTFGKLVASAESPSCSSNGGGTTAVGATPSPPIMDENDPRPPTPPPKDTVEPTRGFGGWDASSHRSSSIASHGGGRWGRVTVEKTTSVVLRRSRSHLRNGIRRSVVGSMVFVDDGEGDEEYEVIMRRRRGDDGGCRWCSMRSRSPAAATVISHSTNGGGGYHVCSRHQFGEEDASIASTSSFSCYCMHHHHHPHPHHDAVGDATSSIPSIERGRRRRRQGDAYQKGHYWHDSGTPSSSSAPGLKEDAGSESGTMRRVRTNREEEWEEGGGVGGLMEGRATVGLGRDLGRRREE
ncbi:hypothetical protein HDU67_009800 [Dinochytrium kinnereticum]|nr:hypothetical protein HDU67_009800 [Dinochytrium kinnereticum]